MNVFATSPAHGPAREARAEIDAVAVTLRESAAPFDRRGVADRLARAVGALYAVLDTTLEAPAHHDGLVECARVLAEARRMLAASASPPEPALLRAIGALDATYARVSRSAEEVVDLMLARRGDLRGGAYAEARATRPFQASVGVPRLHALARAPALSPLSLDPASPALVAKPRPKPPPKPRTIEELRAAASAKPAPPPEPAADPGPAGSVAVAAEPEEGEILRRVARDCLEDVAALRSLRKPIPTETWLDQAPFEQRLLDNVDAFAALGEAALPSVTLFHAEAPAPDPSRGFAVALVLGCVEGTDTADVAVATMKQSAPEELPGFAEGFVLAPNPAIDAELAPLLDAPNPALVAVAIDVLGARGSLPADAPERVLPRADAGLTRRLATALGRALPKTKALAVLSNLLDDEPDDELFAIACASLLRRGDGDVRQRLRDTLRARVPGRIVQATRLLALSGRQDDLPLLLEGVALAPNAVTIDALARHGHPDAASALIALLDSPDEGVAPAAAEALDLLTGAGLRETVQVPWTPGVAPPDGSPPPTRAVSKPIGDRLAWERWFATARGRLDPRAKLRGGLPFAPSMIVDELESTAPPARRSEAALELVIATGVGARFTTTTWVGRQRRELAELRAHVRSLGSAAGAWWFAGAAVTSR
ncbi:MAG: hypothetical protein KIS78_18195 [Labilithrix sp.]|nr:hypothetical protein [Labilithrix sp.]MCW5834336.1 hypothetical protein [Labilithrix sp.]